MLNKIQTSFIPIINKLQEELNLDLSILYILYYLVGKGHTIAHKSVSWELFEWIDKFNVTLSGGIEMTEVRWEHETDVFQAYELWKEDS